MSRSILSLVKSRLFTNFRSPGESWGFIKPTIMSETKDLVMDKVNTLLSEVGLLKALSIDHVNHKPHRFMIGPKHVSYASENYSGILDERTLAAVPCAHPKCHLLYIDHRSDKVLFMQLTRNGNKEEADAELKKIVDIMKDNKIDGIVMVETDENYRIT